MSLVFSKSVEELFHCPCVCGDGWGGVSMDSIQTSLAFVHPSFHIREILFLTHKLFICMIRPVLKTSSLSYYREKRGVRICFWVGGWKVHIRIVVELEITKLDERFYLTGNCIFDLDQIWHLQSSWVYILWIDCIYALWRFSKCRKSLGRILFTWALASRDAHFHLKYSFY